MTDLETLGSRQLLLPPIGSSLALPRLITGAGAHAERRFVEFFTANIRNRNTRAAYAKAVTLFFDWCDLHDLSLAALDPILVSAYVEQLMLTRSPPTVKQHLAAVRMLCDWLVLGQVIPMNPAASVRGPKHVVKVGKTMVLSAELARKLLDSIEVSTVIGLRDRALIAVMVYSFARVSAVVGMNVGDYWQNGKRWWLRLHEKGGKEHDLPAHHNTEAYLDAYLAAAGIGSALKSPLFRAVPGRTGVICERGMSRKDALQMIKRRAAAAGLSSRVCCHTFRATGITTYLENAGTLEKAQAIAAHESPRTTKLYDRTSDAITLDEIERIRI